MRVTFGTVEQSGTRPPRASRTGAPVPFRSLLALMFALAAQLTFEPPHQDPRQVALLRQRFPDGSLETFHAELPQHDFLIYRVSPGSPSDSGIR